MNLLVLCVGNICRSPYAEMLLKKQLPGVSVSSAGLQALSGHPADPPVQALASEQGLDLTAHRARQVLAEHLANAHVVLVMSQGQRNELHERHPFVRGRVFLLDAQGQDIPDPYQHPDAVHRAVQVQIQEGVQYWVPRLKRLQGDFHS